MTVHGSWTRGRLVEAYTQRQQRAVVRHFATPHSSTQRPKFPPVGLASPPSRARPGNERPGSSPATGRTGARGRGHARPFGVEDLAGVVAPTTVRGVAAAAPRADPGDHPRTCGEQPSRARSR